jgi:hypothetical protein
MNEKEKANCKSFIFACTFTSVLFLSLIIWLSLESAKGPAPEEENKDAS